MTHLASGTGALLLSIMELFLNSTFRPYWKIDEPGIRPYDNWKEL